MTTTHSDRTTVTVPADSPTAADLAALDFEADEQAVKPIMKEVRLQWFNGLATDQGMMAIGWHIQADVHPQLDETMEGMGVARYVVQHRTPGKDGQPKQLPYWKLPTCSLIVIALGVQSVFQMRDTTERLGIAYGREKVRDEKGAIKLNEDGSEKTQSVLKLRAFVHELVQNGYGEWLPITLTGTITDCMLEALSQQFRVLEAYGDYARAQGKGVTTAPFYGFSLTLAPGQVKMVGKPNAQSPIYPMQAVLPATIDSSYLAAHLVPKDLLARIRQGLLDEIVLWSVEESGRIIAGKDGTGEDGHHDRSLLSAVQSGSDDPPIADACVKWLTQTYCHQDEARIAALCQRFGVDTIAQLCMSQYRVVIGEWKAAKTPQQ